MLVVFDVMVDTLTLLTNVGGGLFLEQIFRPTPNLLQARHLLILHSKPNINKETVIVIINSSFFCALLRLHRFKNTLPFFLFIVILSNVTALFFDKLLK